MTHIPGIPTLRVGQQVGENSFVYDLADEIIGLWSHTKNMAVIYLDYRYVSEVARRFDTEQIPFILYHEEGRPKDIRNVQGTEGT